MPFDDLADVVDQEDGAAGGIGAAAEPSAGMGAAGALGGLEGRFGGGMRDSWDGRFLGLAGHPDELQGAIANIGPDIVWNRCVGRRGWWEARPHSGWAFTAL